MLSYSEFDVNLSRVKEEIAQACQLCNRDMEDVLLLPVTKNHPVDAVIHCEKAGFSQVGENRVQEVQGKQEVFSGQICWELIGHLQSNKAKLAVQLFDRIQSVDSIKLARKIDSAACAINKVQNILLQVNSGNDPAKFGLDMEQTEETIENILALENLKLDGLMTIAPLSDDLSVTQKCFSNLRILKEKMEAQFHIQLPELSMGMSGDLKYAIAEGSTMIRVGTALFGQRVY